MRVALWMMVAALMGAPDLGAQEVPDTEFSRKALRVRSGFFSTTVVRGVDGEKLGDIGMFGGDIDFLSRREDEIGRRFRSYRSKQIASRWLFLGSFASMTAAGMAHEPWSRSNQTSKGLFAGSVALVLGAIVSVASAKEDLSQTVFHYNGTLDTGQE